VVFAKQRQFPLSIIGWVSLIDLLFNLTDVLIRSIPPAQVWSSGLGPGCQFAAAVAIFFQVASVITNTLLAFTIFTLIYRRRDMSEKKAPAYKYSFLGIFWVYTIAFGVGVTMGPIANPQQNCGPGSLPAVLALLIPFCILVAFQIGFIAMTVYHVKSVSSNIREQITDHEQRARRKDYFVYARFIAILVVQIFQGFPVMIFWTVAALNTVPSIAFLEAVAYLGLAMTLLNSVIIMASNRSLRKWFFETVLRREMDSSLSTSRSSIGLAVDGPAALP